MTAPRVLVASSAVDYGFRYADTSQRHPLGMFVDKEFNGRKDGRRFRYGFVGTGGLQSEFGCCFSYKTIAYTGAPAQVTGTGVIGSRYVTVTIGASEQPASGAFIVDDPFLVGGYVVICNGARQHPMNRMIVGNTSCTNAGGTIVLTLDEPLDLDVTAATTGIEIMFNRWAYVTTGNIAPATGYGQGFVTFLGMPAVTCAAGVYAWIQTRGPCWITSDGNTCDSAADRRIYFASNGSAVSGNDVTGDVGVQQFAGNAMDASSTGASNTPFVWLEME
jgi:hypothetical protein